MGRVGRNIAGLGRSSQTKFRFRRVGRNITSSGRVGRDTARLNLTQSNTFLLDSSRPKHSTLGSIKVKHILFQSSQSIGSQFELIRWKYSTLGSNTFNYIFASIKLVEAEHAWVEHGQTHNCFSRVCRTIAFLGRTQSEEFCFGRVSPNKASFSWADRNIANCGRKQKKTLFCFNIIGRKKNSSGRVGRKITS